MPPLIHGFDPPERFVTGTVGPPGQRTFFLQARSGSRIVSVSLEKQQVVALAERVDQLLDEVMSSRSTEGIVPALAPLDLEDSEPLEQPIEEEFRAGTMTLSWDPDDERVVIEVFPFTEAAVVSPEQVDEDLEEPEPDEIFLVRLDAGSARAFVKRAERVVEAGRPTCPVLRRPDRPRRPSLRAGQRLPPPGALGTPVALTEALLEDDLVLHGRIMPASNATFLGRDRRREGRLQAGVGGAARSGTSRTAPWPDREVAAYLVSEAMGWDVVPQTWLRDGPHGTGMVQVWQEPDPEQEAVTLVAEGRVPDGWRHVFDGIDGQDRPISLIHEDTGPLRRMAVFDAVVNNADRKGGHVLEMADGHRYGVDHGVSLHAETKLRTVLWGWAGEPLTNDEVIVLAELRTAVLRRPGRGAGPAPHGPRDRRAGPALRPAGRPRRPAPAARRLPGHPVATLLTAPRLGFWHACLALSGRPRD